MVRGIMPSMEEVQANKKRCVELQMLQGEQKLADLELQCERLASDNLQHDAERTHACELAQMEIEKIKVSSEQENKNLELKLKLAELEYNMMKLKKGAD